LNGWLSLTGEVSAR